MIKKVKFFQIAVAGNTIYGLDGDGYIWIYQTGLNLWERIENPEIEIKYEHIGPKFTTEEANNEIRI